MSEFQTLQCLHNGTVLEGFVARPESTRPLPAVLMFPGGAGAGETFRQVVRELGEAGFTAIGIDMYGRDADTSTPKAAGPYFQMLMEQPELLRARAVAWFETVSAMSGVDPNRIAAVGYCFGGKCVLELARSGAPVRSVTSFHGLLATHAPARPGDVIARIAIWTGGRDPYAPVAHLDALRKELDRAGVDYQATLFAKAQHSFTDPDHDGFAEGIAYDPLAHRIAWAGTLALLEELQGP